MSDTRIIELSAREIERYTQGLIELIEPLTEEQLWSVKGGIPNSIGTLVRHLTGNLNHYFGTGLLENGYVRDREYEFVESGLPKAQVIAELKAAVVVARQSLAAIDEERVLQPYTTPCGRDYESFAYHVLRMLTHFVVHCGQADYALNLIR
jgi:hypothetical protein